MKNFLIILFLSMTILSSVESHCQDQKKEGKGKDKVKLQQADELEGGVFHGKKIVKFKGNVIFKQKETLLYCDSAYQYKGKEKNTLEAFGNVRIVQGDSLNLTGNRLTYHGDTKQAVMTGNVYLRDKTMNLNTEYLQYNLKEKQAHYINGGTINDGKSTLTSEMGTYNTGSKIFHFKKNVKVVNPSKNFTLTSDTLDYNTRTKIANFKGPTHIESPDGIIDTEVGSYNTVTGKIDLNVVKNAPTIKSGAYKLTADEFSYDEKGKMAIAKKNVVLFSEKDKIIIHGDQGRHWESKGVTKIFGNALMKVLMENDTLYLRADTLISIDSKDPNQKRLLAFPHSKIFKSDLQGKCDSLVYNFADSTIYFFTDPVLWSGQNQITADSINILMKNNKIHKMNLTLNSFIVSQDTLKNFNQVKGRNMTGHFKNDHIYRIDVDGNGESIYYALEKDSALTGMNKVVCSNMIIRLDSNKLKGISFIKKPDGRFVPPHEIQEPETRLKGFVWRREEKPQLADMLGVKKLIDKK